MVKNYKKIPESIAETKNFDQETMDQLKDVIVKFKETYTYE